MSDLAPGTDDGSLVTIGNPTTTDAVEAQADAADAELAKVYAAGASKVGTNPDSLLNWVTAGAFSGLLQSSTEDAVAANYRTLGTEIQAWRTTYRQWARAGVRDDGTAYTYAEWFKVRDDYARACGYQSAIAWDSSLVASTVTAAKDAALSVATPSLWPDSVKTAVAVGVVLVGLLLVWQVSR